MKNSINNWFKKNTKEEEKIFRQGLLAFLIFIIVLNFHAWLSDISIERLKNEGCTVKIRDYEYD